MAYRLARASRVWLTIYDLQGREVRRIVDGLEQGAGRHRVLWGDLSPGVYFLRLRTDSEISSTPTVAVR